MQDRGSINKARMNSSEYRRLGSYLIEAGLLTPAQVDVALNDQKIMDGMRFGEVLDARGWVKQQTIEFFMRKIVEPERRAAEERVKSDQETLVQAVSNPNPMRTKPLAATRATLDPAANRARGDVSSNERKSLPSVNTADNDVSWVG